MVNAAPSYIPDRGHVVWMTLDPQAGHEQAGRRPAIVLSPASYNRLTGLAICCPISGRVKGYIFEVPLPTGLPVSGVVLADHAKSLDWRARRADTICDLPQEITTTVLARLVALLSGDDT